ncbi:hypothetical protein [Leucobacter coleopterorum]|uniref:hypothetical protein n=1 Tax=Leucobacter coleopterorum TaxID=2714933 RepID=UPI001FCB26EB|nr:hypothetical protein [Leucobacter coleopterorum]
MPRSASAEVDTVVQGYACLGKDRGERVFCDPRLAEVEPREVTSPGSRIGDTGKLILN